MDRAIKIGLIVAFINGIIIPERGYIIFGFLIGFVLTKITDMKNIPRIKQNHIYLILTLFSLSLTTVFVLYVYMIIMSMMGIVAGPYSPSNMDVLYLLIIGIFGIGGTICGGEATMSFACKMSDKDRVHCWEFNKIFKES